MTGVMKGYTRSLDYGSYDSYRVLVAVVEVTSLLLVVHPPDSAFLSNQEDALLEVSRE